MCDSVSLTLRSLWDELYREYNDPTTTNVVWTHLNLREWVSEVSKERESEVSKERGTRERERAREREHMEGRRGEEPESERSKA